MKCGEIHSGMLRHKISIEREDMADDDYGGQDRTFATLVNCYAFIKPTSGTERFLAEQVQAEVSHDITIRYFSGLLPKDIIVYNERRFNITAIINVEERNVWLILKCNEGGAV